MEVSAAPFFFPLGQRCRRHKTLASAQPFESAKPVRVIAGVRIASGRGRLDLFREGGTPLGPGEVASFRQMHRQREGLRLPRFVEDWMGILGMQVPRPGGMRASIGHDIGSR
jgi:hypothetical protein